VKALPGSTNRVAPLNGLSLLLSVGKQRYAVPCLRVKEVIPDVDLEPEPRAPPWLAGLFNYRGAITPVIDLCQLVSDLPCAERLSSRIVVFEHAGAGGAARPAGLLAERVTETRVLKVQHRNSTQRDDQSCFREVFLDETGMIHCIDLDRVVQNTLARHADIWLPGTSDHHAAREHREPA
jgi:chemotaxis-related protein WspB